MGPRERRAITDKCIRAHTHQQAFKDGCQSLLWFHNFSSLQLWPKIYLTRLFTQSWISPNWDFILFYFFALAEKSVLIKIKVSLIRNVEYRWSHTSSSHLWRTEFIKPFPEANYKMNGTSGRQSWVPEEQNWEYIGTFMRRPWIFKKMLTKASCSSKTLNVSI